MSANHPRVVFFVVDAGRLSGDDEVSEEFAIACFLPSQTSIELQLAFVGHLSATCLFMDSRFDTRKVPMQTMNGAPSDVNDEAQVHASTTPKPVLSNNPWQLHFVESQAFRYVFVVVGAYQIVLGVSTTDYGSFDCTFETISAWLVAILELAALCNGQLSSLLTYCVDADANRRRSSSAVTSDSLSSETGSSMSLDRANWAAHKSKLNRIFRTPVSLLERVLDEDDFVAQLSISFSALPSFSMMTSTLTDELSRREINSAIQAASQYLGELCKFGGNGANEPSVALSRGCVFGYVAGCHQLLATNLPARLTWKLAHVTIAQLAEPPREPFVVGDAELQLQSHFAARRYRVHLSPADIRHTADVDPSDSFLEVVNDALRRDHGEYTMIELRRVATANSRWFTLLIVETQSVEPMLARVSELIQLPDLRKQLEKIDDQLRSIGNAYDKKVSRRNIDVGVAEIHASFATCASVLNVTTERGSVARVRQSFLGSTRKTSLTAGLERQNEAATNRSNQLALQNAHRTIMTLTEQIGQSLAVARSHVDGSDEDEEDEDENEEVERERIKSIVLVSENQQVAVTCSDRGEFDACATTRSAITRSSMNGAGPVTVAPYCDLFGDSYRNLREFLDRVDQMSVK